MLNSMLTETLALDRRRQLLDEAARDRLARQSAPSTPAPIRVRAGLLLVRIGLRLAPPQPGRLCATVDCRGHNA